MDGTVGVDVDDTLGVRVWVGWRRVGVERREEKSLDDGVVDVIICGVNWELLFDRVLLVVW